MSKKDVIVLNKMRFYAHHGYYQEEAKLGGHFEVGLKVYVNFEEAAEDDDLAKTVNYEKLFALVDEEMKTNSKLLEHLAKRIAERIIRSYLQVDKVKVKIDKLNPPIKGNIAYVGVKYKLAR